VNLTPEQVEELNQEARQILMNTLDSLVQISDSGGYVAAVVICVGARHPDQDGKTVTQNFWHTNRIPYWEGKGLMQDVMDRWDIDRWIERSGDMDD
jgi:predicted secreted hydrolase